MSRSFKRPIVGHTCKESEKRDKTRANRHFRRNLKESIDNPKKLKSRFEFAKDGKQRLSLAYLLTYKLYKNGRISK